MTPSMGFPGDDQRDVASGDVEAFLDEVRTNLRTSVPRGTADRHVRAMVAAAERPIPWWTLQSLRSSVAQPLGGVPRWAAALALTALFGSSALAATGNLPTPVQRVVADTVSHIGLDLPDPDDDAPDGDEDVGGTTDGGGVENTDEVTTRTQPENHGSTVASVAREEFDSGCERGQAVRDVASSAADPQGRAEGRDEDHDPCAQAGDGAPTDSDATDDADADEPERVDQPAGSTPEYPGGGPPDHARTRSSGNAGGPQD